MFGPLLGMFSPRGTGGRSRGMAQTGLASAREADRHLDMAGTPPSFDVRKLGSVVLFTTYDGMRLTVRSVGLADPMIWIGPCSIKARPLDLIGLIHPIDRQKFLDYVFNFKNVLYDLGGKTCAPVLPGDLPDLLPSQGGPRRSLKLVQIAARASGRG